MKRSARWPELLLLVIVTGTLAWLSRPAPPPEPESPQVVAIHETSEQPNAGNGILQVAVVLQRASRPPLRAAQTVMERFVPKGDPVKDE